MSSSKMPDGGYQPTYAGNYGLDGFDFSEEYGEGPATNHKIPTTNRTTGMTPVRSESGMSHLPDGFVTGTRAAAHGDDVFAGADGTDLGDLSGMVREAGHLTDLTWLETAEQDPDRLPHHHNDAVLQGLVEAWGINRRTDGVDLVPNVVVPPPPRSQVALLPGDDTLRQIAASAMRKSAFGVPFENILSDMAAHLGPDVLSRVGTDPRLQRFASAVRSIKAENGLSGAVYLRDSAFPGLLTGKWDREIKRRCASAKYWLTRPGSKLAAYQNYLGKRVVTVIPWGDALEQYRPMLEASGKRLASGDPKAVLLSAFRSDAVKVASEASHTYHLTPAQRVSTQEAWRVFASAPTPKREVLQRDSARVTLDMAQQRVAGWVQSRALDEGTARKLLASGLSPDDMISEGANLVVRKLAQQAQYAGGGIGVTAPSRKSANNSDWAKNEQARLAGDREIRSAKLAREKITSVFSGWVRAGMMTREDADRLMSRKGSVDELLAQARDFVQQGRMGVYHGEGVGASVHAGSGTKKALAAPQISMAKVATTFQGWVRSGLLLQASADEILSLNVSNESRMRLGAEAILQIRKDDYRGIGLDQVNQTPLPTKKLAHALDPKVARVLRYASVQMNEGMAGNDLDVMLNSRFSQEYLKGASAQLVQLRRKHEGLAGHVYVTASAYASASGTTGCEAGALVHRANQVKALLQMDRCGSCSANSGGSCQKYAKQLVTAAPVSNPDKYQRETIRLANADDHERTAAMFNPGEYDLQNDNLDSFDYSNLPDNQTLHGILFEGMVLPEE